MKTIMALCALSLMMISCADNYKMISRPAEGYNTILLKRSVSISQGIRGTWTFPAGTLLVADRTLNADGSLLYCGIGVMSGQATLFYCVQYDHSSFTIIRPMTGEVYSTPVSTEDVEEKLQ